jgi:hypothetical protein
VTIVLPSSSPYGNASVIVRPYHANREKENCFQFDVILLFYRQFIGTVLVCKNLSPKIIFKLVVKEERRYLS